MKKLVFVLFFLAAMASAQEVTAFEEEVRAIEKKYDTLWNASKETIVFTGSSSIRIWHDLQERFPQHQIVNSGFGGSQASDLVHYCDALILQYTPKKVFIYEGDNDIAAGKHPKEIIKSITAIIKKIKAQDATTEIVLIAAKPSITRWNLKRNYKQLNRRFKKMSQSDVRMNYADVWKPMLHRRKVKETLFSADGLHMNAKGYAIWYEVLKPFLEK